jgi:hypothetical protein
MKYLCLRNCFVNGRFYTKGQTYELGEEQVNSPKNFKLVAVKASPPEESGQGEGEESTKKTEGVKPNVIPKGMFWCSNCKVLHRESSRVGKRHLKFKEA